MRTLTMGEMRASCTAAVAICSEVLHPLHGDIRDELILKNKQVEKKFVRGTGDSVPVKGLSSGPQIQAQWSAKNYRYGGEMLAIEHVMYRHTHGSGFKEVSRFLPGTKARDVKSYVDIALRQGQVIPNGPGGFKVEVDLKNIIGTTKQGVETSKIRVLVRDGTIQSVFPI
ncbi:MAG: hypothetical protein OXT67_03595 [Zetaproteobacteria bacterium]|nr:hypothetical protein [Zetaproteobacteria bacterium]